MDSGVLDPCSQILILSLFVFCIKCLLYYFLVSVIQCSVEKCFLRDTGHFFHLNQLRFSELVRFYYKKHV